MALPTASDNPWPSLLVVEGSAPSSPASGKQRVFIDSSDHKLKRKDSGGTVTTIEGGGGGGSGTGFSQYATGRVLAGGTISQGGAVGQGFTVAKPSTGHYTISFTSSFSGVPYVIVTAETDAGGNVRDWSIDKDSVATSGFLCRFTDATAAAYQDVNWWFLAFLF